jgi:hypothetical protein
MLFVQGGSLTPHLSSSRPLFVCINLVGKGSQNFSKNHATWLTDLLL